MDVAHLAADLGCRLGLYPTAAENGGIEPSDY